MMTEPNPWWRVVFDQHESRLIAYAKRLTGNVERAKDIVQEAFLRLLQEERAVVESHVVAWLYTVCRNLAIDLLRKESRMTVLDDKHWRQTAVQDPKADQQIESHETNHSLLAFIESLPEQQQEVLRLKFNGGLSYRQIAAILSVSESNVGFLLSTALKTIRGCWPKQNVGEVL